MNKNIDISKPLPPNEVDKIPFGSDLYRDYFRKHVAMRLHGRVYATLVISYMIVATLTFVYLLPEFGLKQFYLMVGFFIFCNFCEYVFHRFPMHSKMKGVEPVYEHVTIHHNFFANEYFYFQGERDIYAGVLPPKILFGLSAFIVLVTAIVGFLTTKENGHLFGICGFGYYLLYELTHFTYHLPESSFLKGFKVVRFLAQHHITHHQVKNMSRYNFNISLPIFDFVLGTYLKAEKSSVKETQEIH